MCTLKLVLLVAMLGAVDAQPRNYNPSPEEEPELTEHGRELGWQRFYSRTHSHEEEYETTLPAWGGTGPGMTRGADLKMTESTDTWELQGGHGAWSGGDVRLDRTNHKWGDYVRQNCTDPNGLGIETLASGVQYFVAVNGSGSDHPKDDSPCNIHYEARKSIDGVVSAGEISSRAGSVQRGRGDGKGEGRGKGRPRACLSKPYAYPRAHTAPHRPSPVCSFAFLCRSSTPRTKRAWARRLSPPASPRRRGERCC